MNSAQLQNLIEKYNNQTATPEEKMQLEDWYASINGDNPEFSDGEEGELKEDIYSSVINSIKNGDIADKGNSKAKNHYLNLAWAAIFVAVLFGGVFIYLNKTNSTLLSNASRNFKKGPIKPGGNNAILTLADGTELILNQTADGQIANQSGVKVTKTKSGELVYTFLPDSKPENIQNNTVSTPRGGQYHLVLVDGTEVWLNAASSITFPTAFVGNDRKVKVTGEVYFEVSKDKQKPFMVNTNQSEIKVLGTHFNVNAYEDEDYQKTTLLEGAIEIKKGNLTKLLSPGEQANISTVSETIKIKQIENLDAVIAWKNGYFQFLGSDLQSFMRQISRWYDTEVIYNGSIPVKEYTGKIPRNSHVDDLIKMLSYSGIHCKVENNKITINPK
ncbi:MAG: FecR family protein [Pedobacter sp.]|nr:MAG: FecR family protein [Pedobacter sp.]